MAGLFLNYAGAQDDLNELIKKEVNSSTPFYTEVYKDLHLNPELSQQEFRTSKKMQQELLALGFEVTMNVGGNSLVGVYKNGNGPVIMMRTDMDALPILEKTGLPFASTVKAKNIDGITVPVMHACGHDMHMSVFLSTANALVKLKRKWSGTLVFIAQQAEEGSNGADRMISDGLFKRFPKPNYIMAYHVSSTLPSGTIGYCIGPTFACVTSVDIIFKGVGGHGAYPEKTIDPIVMASRAVLDFQTIVSRELLPLDPAVVTVGSINGGFQYNIIPDEVKMQLTIRTYKDEVREHILEAIRRISKHIALSARMPEDNLPEVTILKDPTPPVINNEALVMKAVASYRNIIGESNVTEVPPAMVAEDFGRYGLTEEKIPIFMTWLGAVSPEKISIAKKEGSELPPLHSPFFVPDTEVTMKTGALAMTRAIIDLMKI